ncbi:hypothetical protein [Microbacterium sp. SLBN-146]|uniref:hypothetical protein n=1 Tax=Microbacterium sp. SLBN-146 TaxID=2768457 RepID=UPI0011543AD6|nr:hypothetical protein [Microbacterium sp. SLBN-146]TQJ30436.1 hypothetical protein FBY39_0888 [Microbacterium sp. SLBN-146]
MTRRLSRRSRSARRGVAPVAVLAAAAMCVIAVPAAASDTDDEHVLWPFVCSVDGVCLAMTATLADSDGDGIVDIDEEVLGTDLSAAASAPRVEELVSVVGKGALPSFEMGFSEVIVIPETLPDGTRLVPEGPSAGRESTLARLGIDESVLKGFGLDVPGGFAVDSVLGALGITLGKDGRPVKKEGSPVGKRIGGVGVGEISQEKDGPDMGDQPAFGTDRNGGADTAKTLGQRAYELFFGPDKKSDPPKGGADGGVDGGTDAPKKLTTGDEGNVVLPLTAEDMDRALAKLGFDKTPVQDDPKVAPDIAGVDLNPRRTVILVVDPEPSERFQSLLKIVLTTPNPENPADRNTNFGPGGGLLTGVVPDSAWPKA